LANGGAGPNRQWLRQRDPGLSALRRAARTAIIMPSMFALGSKIIGNPTVATFAAFGSFAMLLLVGFGGTRRDRIIAQTALVGASSGLICIATLVSRSVWLAALATAVVGFGVLFAGVVSSVLAGASTSLLLAFILPVTLAAPASSLPDRLEGWLLAGAVSIGAITLLWPSPAEDPLRKAAAEACRLLAIRLQADVAFVLGRGVTRAVLDAAVEASSASVSRLRTTFFATPYRPTGLTTEARTVVRLVDEIEWLNAILDQLPPGTVPAERARTVCAVRSACGAVLERGAALLESPSRDLDGLPAELVRLRDRLDLMEREVTRVLPVDTVSGPHGPASEFVTSLEPSFRAQEMSFAISAIAANIELTVLAQLRPWWQQLLGHQPNGVGGPFASAQQRASARVERHSVWLHNSLRGAVALTVAVVVAKQTGLQHSFWVVLGTLSVLRSNALSTGQNALRGLAGTAAGFVVGGVLVLAIGTDETVLWVLLPLAILFAGLAPAVSFAAGQAGFTITLLILYNIIDPTGWSVGLVRVEDVAIGCLVSLVVGTLFWPRGAASALGRALAEAYSESAAYLQQAVAFAVARCDAQSTVEPTPRTEDLRAAAAARRLDDAFRGFLAERGTKHLPLATVATLITGVAGLRLTADAVLDLWEREDGSSAGDRSAVRIELLAEAEVVAGWFDSMARALIDDCDVPDALPHDKLADLRLITAVRRDLGGEDGRGSASAVRMIWTADHLDAARRLQLNLVEPARAVAQVRRRLHPDQWRAAIRRAKPRSGIA
jgi:uncharacterized membrane protein YccC